MQIAILAVSSLTLVGVAVLAITAVVAGKRIDAKIETEFESLKKRTNAALDSLRF